MTKQLGSLSCQVRGYAQGQSVFVVLSNRSKSATILYVSIAKDPCDRLVQRFRTGLEAAAFGSAVVKAGYLSSAKEITLYGAMSMNRLEKFITSEVKANTVGTYEVTRKDGARLYSFPTAQRCADFVKRAKAAGVKAYYPLSSEHPCVPGYFTALVQS